MGFFRKNSFLSNVGFQLIFGFQQQSLLKDESLSHWYIAFEQKHSQPRVSFMYSYELVT